MISRLGGHSHERTHRGKEKFPGMTITMALLTALEKIEEEFEHMQLKLNELKDRRIKEVFR